MIVGASPFLVALVSFIQLFNHAVNRCDFCMCVVSNEVFAILYCHIVEFAVDCLGLKLGAQKSEKNTDNNTLLIRFLLYTNAVNLLLFPK